VSDPHFLDAVEALDARLVQLIWDCLSLDAAERPTSRAIEARLQAVLVDLEERTLKPVDENPGADSSTRVGKRKSSD